MKKKDKNRNNSKLIAPLLTFVIVFALMSLILGQANLYKLITSLIISLVSALIAILLRKNKKADEPDPVTAVQEMRNDQIDLISKEGKLALGEMGRLYGSINNTEIRLKINEIMRITDKIIQDAKADPSDVPQIKKFMNYYLPTTIKLLNAYDRMDNQGIDGDNLNKSKQSIEEMLDTAIEAYQKRLDSLFEDQALDIETDIQVMNTLLAREGLIDNKEQTFQTKGT